MNKEIKVGELKHQYDKEFVPTQEYLDSSTHFASSESCPVWHYAIVQPLL